MDKLREEFEAWAYPRLFMLRREKHDPEQYEKMDTECAWQAYQAASASRMELERDAERYRWLREVVNKAGGPVIAMNGGVCPGQGDLFDAAIDAARAVLSKEQQ